MALSSSRSALPPVLPVQASTAPRVLVTAAAPVQEHLIAELNAFP